MWISELKVNENDNNKNKRETWLRAIRLLEKLLTRRTVHKNLMKSRRLKMGRICVVLSDQLEKQLRLKTIEKFGGKKGDLTRAVEEAVKTWITKE
jgi:hypothetical protein